MMLSWLWKRSRPSGKPPLPGGNDEAATVRVNETSIAVPQADGTVETLLWADLGRVTVLTTDRGPAETDLFWVLSSRDNRRRLVVPLGAPGERELLKAMQRRLHGFDNMRVVEAMSSTRKASFVVWEHGKRELGLM
jgi:hypothetical protein